MDEAGIALRLEGEEVTLHPERALYWPARRTLIVADLHWGKEESFRAHGIPLPRGPLQDDLEQLGRVCRRTGAGRLVVLGDLIHSREGVSREVIDQVAAWRQEHRLEMILVRGNHDRHLPELPGAWEIRSVAGALLEAPFVLAHHPEPAEGGYVLSGHLHPTYRVRSRSDSLRLPCFHFGAAVGVLPAFSRFTGGVGMSRRAGERVFVIAGEEVVEV